MVWILVLAVVAFVVIVWRSAGREPQRSYPPREPALPPPVTRSAPPLAAPAPPPTNVLQPYSPIPLSVVGASPQAVATLQTLLKDEGSHGRDRREAILEWLLTTNGRIEEIDAFLGEWGPRFSRSVKSLCEADPDWVAASPLDREDIHVGACLKAVATLEVRVQDLRYEVIAEPPSMPATADDTLLARYGLKTLSFYLRNADDLERIHASPSEDWYRPRFEDLVSKELARRGADIDPRPMLTTLTLKQMEQLVPDLEHKRFTRRAPAIEFLSAVPDLKERMGRTVSFRELFQLMPLPAEFSSIDLSALGHAWAYAAEYAKLIDLTAATAARARSVIQNATQDEYAKGWEVDANVFGDELCCPLCAKAAGVKRGVRRPPALPHHVGCVCSLSQIYEL